MYLFFCFASVSFKLTAFRFRSDISVNFNSTLYPKYYISLIIATSACNTERGKPGSQILTKNYSDENILQTSLGVKTQVTFVLQHIESLKWSKWSISLLPLLQCV